MKLVIVESPAKSRTISHYLGEDYQVEASVGHICDLATKGKGGLGVDVDNNFKATYSISKDKTDIVKKLKNLAKKSEEVILATDPDREGEAIAYHLANFLNLPIDTTKRLEFHEITKESITKAIEEPRTIDMNLVHSQEARRIIDRIIGFKISTLINNRIKSKSAGRVQSVTLKLICDHEKEIEEFIPEEYWKIFAKVNYDNQEILCELFKFKGNSVTISSKDEADAIAANCSSSLVVSHINKTTRHISSKEPFRTSTLQQEAFTKYNFKTKETTSLAQKLYEGIELDEGLTGLITYIRTDSTKLSDSFVAKTKDFIVNKYGISYCKENALTKKVTNSQDAHEAIRPTSIERTPESVKKYLTDHEYKLYKLIYNRTIASLMSDKEIESTQVLLDSNDVTFKYDQSKVLFEGYDILKIDDKEPNSSILFKEGDSIDILSVEKKQNFTKAPSRYSEGKLVKIMEDEGIGRPSTYSSTIQTLIQRKYIISEKGILSPTEQGKKTSLVLTKYFPELMSVEYTADMENSLDKISVGEENEVKVLNEFYSPFIEHFDQVKTVMYKDEPEYTGEICPLCGSKLVLRHGRFGEFTACSNYPTCKYIKKEPKPEPEKVGRVCPNCGSELVYRRNKQGQTFIGCSNYPKCKYIEGVDSENEEKKICPKCGAALIRKKGKVGFFWGCSNYPKCDYIEPIKKKSE